MQALVYAVFEHATNMEDKFSELDLLFADVRTAMEGLAESQQHLGRLKEKQKNALDSRYTAFIELNNRRDLHDAACRGLEDAGMKTIELKRKADEAFDQIRAHRDRQATKEFETAEEDLNDRPSEAAYKRYCGHHPRAIVRRPGSRIEQSTLFQEAPIQSRSFSGGGRVGERLRSPLSNVSNSLNLLGLRSDVCAV